MLAIELHKEAGPARHYVEALARLGVLTKDPYVNGYLGDIGVPRDPAAMDFRALLVHVGRAP